MGPSSRILLRGGKKKCWFDKEKTEKFKVKTYKLQKKTHIQHTKHP